MVPDNGRFTHVFKDYIIGTEQYSLTPVPVTQRLRVNDTYEYNKKKNLLIELPQVQYFL